MNQYFTQADGIPHYINMMEEAEKKSKPGKVPIVMMALAAVLAAQHFAQDVDDWEGLAPTSAPRVPGRCPSALPTLSGSTDVSNGRGQTAQ